MKAGIIIPHRDRLHNINTIIPKIKQNLLDFNHNYAIVVANQDDNEKFNKGFNMNVGAHLALEKHGCDYLIFHDTDANPMNTDTDLYGPRENSGCLTRWYAGFGEQNDDQGGIFGGAVYIKKNDYLKINGWGNCFWGWGCEDIEIIPRMVNNDIKLKRGNIKFDNLAHTEDANPRFHKNSNYENNYKLLLISNGNELNYLEEGYSQVDYTINNYNTMFDDENIIFYDIKNNTGPQYILGEDMPKEFLQKVVRKFAWNKWRIN